MEAVMQKIFHKTTWDWWELWLFKVAVFAIGIIVGFYFPTFCQQIMPLVVLLGVGGGFYAAYLWLKKIRF